MIGCTGGGEGRGGEGRGGEGRGGEGRGGEGRGGGGEGRGGEEYGDTRHWPHARGGQVHTHKELTSSASWSSLQTKISLT